MRDYWLTQDLLKAAGFGFMALAGLGIVLALWLPKKWWQKGIALAVVLLLISIPVSQGVKEVAHEQKAVDDYKEKYAKAKALFDERCKTGGEKIHKMVEGVDGIFLMKLRPKETNFGDQFRLDDPYGRDLDGDGYIESFVRGQYAATHVADRGQGTEKWPRGYRYVEVIDPKDSQRYRYTGGMKVVRQMDTTSPNVKSELERNPNYDINIRKFVLEKARATGPAPRYGVTYDDISTQEEREYWIAGSSLKVIDLQTKEVMAERIGYMVDWAQGSRASGRSPWLLAANNICPEYSGHRGSSAQPYQATRFVEKVLKPSK